MMPGVAHRLRHVDPHRRRGLVYRALAAYAASRAGRFISSRLLWKLDPWLLRVTRGRLSTTLIVAAALLETRGAKSGRPRSNAVLYFHDGDRITIVASKAGSPRHPAWFHNLRANPDVVFAGTPMRATIVTDEAERERLWKLADQVFAPYAIYRRDAAKAGRTIPLVQLAPR